ncbi:hypothetical protein HX014_10025 [Myroides marinus]|uniref:hypothetical protein n=1 Tax=Myroides marinus TaxID=703342 RepID=UPI0025789766|nr:hypothetical protein [Myroides marinus]MDM1350940.1 hypothetical protein [Myroides marinus]MDM1358147.1 hypothetical protein [Myroides marinus]
MIIITNSTFDKLCNHIDLDSNSSIDLFKKYIVDNNLVCDYLTKQERNLLIDYALLIDTDNKIDYYNKIEFRQDTKTKVFDKGGYSKYHYYSDCPYLLSDYLDFTIPNIVKQWGDSGIEEYRKWFAENNFSQLYINNPSSLSIINTRFNQRFKNRLGIDTLNENSKLLVIEFANSGNLFLTSDSFDNKEFEKKLRSLLTEIKQVLDRIKPTENLSIWNSHIVYSLSDNSLLDFFHDYIILRADVIEQMIRRIGRKELIKILRDYFCDLHQLKLELKELLMEHIRWNYGSKEIKPTKIRLEDLGLICCKDCYNRKHR